MVAGAENRPFSGVGNSRTLDEEECLLYQKNPCYHTFLTRLPFISLIMQQVNRSWYADQQNELNKNTGHPKFQERKVLLTNRAIDDEKSARIGNVITAIALGVLFITSHALVPTIIFGICYFSSMAVLRRTAQTIDFLEAQLPRANPPPQNNAPAS